MPALTFEQAIERARKLLEEAAPPGVPYSLTFNSGGNGKAKIDLRLTCREGVDVAEVIDELRTKALVNRCA